MARKAPTAEMKAKAEARRERFRELAKIVSDMTDDERAALVARVGTIVTCEGRPLSVHNSCLLLTQLPNVSVVGGFRQWLTAGRAVRKGEHGLMLWVPTGKGKAGEPEPTADDTGDEKGKRSGFIMGTVFDISQTEPTTDRAEPAAPTCQQCGCTSADESRCDVCGCSLVKC
jgi:antirestriction protein ArdC